MIRRHRVIFSLLLLILGLAAAAVYFATSDLERHRHRIEGLLAKKLGQPVQVEQIDFSLLPSPRLECVGLRIGIAEEGRSLEIARLAIAPELLPLLSGRLQLAGIELQQPRLTITLPADKKAEEPPAIMAMPELDWLSVARVTLRDGSLQLIDRRRKETEQLRLEEIEATLENVSMSGIDSLGLSAILIQVGSASPLTLSGSLRLEEGSWRQVAVELDFTLNDFAPASLLSPLPKGVSAAGRADLSLQVKGAAQSGMRFIGRLEGQRLKIHTGQQLLPVLPLKTVELGGLLRANGRQLQLAEFRLSSDLLAAGGSLTARRTDEGALLEAKLESFSLPLPAYPATAGEGPPPSLSLAEGPNTLQLDRLQVAAHLKGWPLPGVAPPAPGRTKAPQPDSISFSGSGKILGREDSGARERQAGFSLSGTLSRLFTDDPHLALKLAGEVPAETLSRLLGPRRWRQGLDLTGTVALELALDGPIKTPRFHLGADLTAAGIDGGRLLTKEAGTEARITLDGRKLPGSISFSGNGKILGQEGSGAREQQAGFSLSGTLSHLFADDPHLALKLAGEVPAETLSRLLGPRRWRQGLDLTGAVTLELALDGPIRTPRFHLGANLTTAGIDGGRLLTKEAGTEGRLTLDGRKRPDSLIIDDARLLDFPVDLQMQGSFAMAAGGGYDLTLTLGKSDLKQSRSLLPILDKIKLRGTVAGSLRLQQGKEPEGALTLENFGLPIKGPLSDLNRFHGEVAIKGKSLHSNRLEGYLGRSPVVVGAGADLSNGFRLTLDVTSDALYATDLIFHDPKAVFRDLSGRVIIEKDAVLLEEVVARLEGGTAVQVEGSISPFKAPDTMLAIGADYGNVDEVIALFKRPEGAPGPAKKAPKKKRGIVLIDIEAKKGKLGDLEFEDAEGFLSVEKKVLTIHPLTFRSAGGSVAGMVLWDGSKPKPNQLKVSGHLQDVSADTLSRRHLKRQGIVTGGLTGNFYIEGLGTGEQFLKSSQGAFNVEIRKGVLRKLHFLSKIFSILNVSQIFRFELPDVSGHGMKYKRLKADLQLKDGLLTSNNLYIDSDSMNMTIVGGYDLVSKHLDLTVGVKPLQTVDKIISSIPIAGWLLTGKEKALITTHFEVKGKAGSEKVKAIPFQSVSDQAKGIFKRLFKLPKKLIEDTERFITGED